MLRVMRRETEKPQKNAADRKGCLKDVRKEEILPFLHPHTCRVCKPVLSKNESDKESS